MSPSPRLLPAYARAIAFALGRAGAKILFCGGMIGTISEVKDATFLVEVAKGVVVEVAKGAVERPLPDKAEPEKK